MGLEIPRGDGFSSPTVRSGLHEHREPLTVQDIRGFYNAGVAIAAAATWQRIHERATTTGLPSATDKTSKGKEAFSDWKKEIDNLATAALRTHLAGADFVTHVLGCEGKKELRKENIKVDTLEGLHGRAVEHIRTLYRDNPEEAEKELEKLRPDAEAYVDPLEGTKFAGSNAVGAVSIFGLGLENGHKMVPPESGDAKYFLRTAAGSKLKGRISLDMPPRDIVGEAMSAFNLRSPSELTIVALGGKTRTRNNELIRRYREAGAAVEEIEGGDLMPALDALRNRPLISVGSGGKEEAMIAAVAAKAVGGFFEGRYVDEDGDYSREHPQTFTLNDLCPGDPDKYLVSLAAITGTPNIGLNLAGVFARGSNGHTLYEVRVVDITSRGLLRHSWYEVNLNERTAVRV